MPQVVFRAPVARSSVVSGLEQEFLQLPVSRVAPHACPMKTISTHFTGLAGVYFVASELIRKGYIASPTVGNTPGIDILAANSDGSKYVNIQVKTSRYKRYFWPLGACAVPKIMRGVDSYYVFVRDDGTSEKVGEGRFEAFVVAGSEVYKFNQNHQRRAERRRKIAFHGWHLPKDSKDKYLNNWGKLGLDC
jgi:hypothetical protein